MLTFQDKPEKDEMVWGYLTNIEHYFIYISNKLKKKKGDVSKFMSTCVKFDKTKTSSTSKV